MAEERALTEEEQKAKEYVDFYYYWLFQYGGRKRFNMLVDAFLNTAGQLKSLIKDIRPVLSTEYIELFSKADLDEDAPALADLRAPQCLRLTGSNRLHRLPFFSLFCHHTENWCSNTKCKVREEAISLCEEYEDMEERLAVGGLFDDLIIDEDAEDSGDNLLYNVLDVGNMHIRSDGSGMVQRYSKNFGLGIIGVKDLSLNSTGCLSGGLIASIDLSAPLPFLLHEIRQLKEACFNKVPTCQDLTVAFEYEEVNYQLERELISSVKGVSFSPKDEKARALGIWFYDVLDVEQKYPSFKEAYEALKNGTWLGERDDENPLTYPLAALGYAASEISVFRRLYRNTKRCIDACEVLSLKD